MTRWLDSRICHPGPHLALCLSEAEYHAAMKHLRCANARSWLNPGADATLHILEDGREMACVVCLDGESASKERKLTEVIGLLVHESVHVWQAYARAIGEEKPGDEQEAYAIQCVAQELVDEWLRRNNRRVRANTRTNNRTNKNLHE